MKRIILCIILFLLAFSFASALVVEELGEKIEEGTAGINSSLIETKAEIKVLQSQINSLKGELAQLQEKTLSKDDLPDIYATIDYLLFKNMQNNVVILLAFAVFFFSILFILKIKKLV